MNDDTKKTTYTPAMKKAIKKYRLNDVEAYNGRQRNYYNNNKDDPEWRERFNERCRKANAIYREKKREELGGALKPQGRPRKIPVVRVANMV
tara:strand:+ start:2809 stop:3084 length:276 start_codon:yes stop_codon:yes gene_type:complete